MATNAMKKNEDDVLMFVLMFCEVSGVLLNRASPGCLLEKGPGGQRLAGRWSTAGEGVVNGDQVQPGELESVLLVRSQVQLLS